MYEQKTVIDGNSFLICDVLLLDGNVVFADNIDFSDKQIVELYNSNLQFTKPHWNGQEWIEGATEEEIQASKEENEVIQEPTIEELLIKEIANLKIEIMQLKGGNE